MEELACAGYMTLDDAETLLDHAIDRLFAETTSTRPARSRSR